MQRTSSQNTVIHHMHWVTISEYEQRRTEVKTVDGVTCRLGMYDKKTGLWKDFSKKKKMCYHHKLHFFVSLLICCDATYYKMENSLHSNCRGGGGGGGGNLLTVWGQHENTAY